MLQKPQKSTKMFTSFFVDCGICGEIHQFVQKSPHSKEKYVKTKALEYGNSRCTLKCTFVIVQRWCCISNFGGEKIANSINKDQKKTNMYNQISFDILQIRTWPYQTYCLTSEYWPVSFCKLFLFLHNFSKDNN